MSLITRMGLLLIGLIITYACVVFLVQLLSPLDSDQTLSRSMSLEISSAINGMISAPPGMTKNYTLPARRCSVFLAETTVNVTAGNYSYESPILIPEFPFRIMATSSLLCEPSFRKTIALTRIGATPENPEMILIEALESGVGGR